MKENRTSDQQTQEPPPLDGREATQTFVKHNHKRAIDKIALYF
jgi:hypothetical protein